MESSEPIVRRIPLTAADLGNSDTLDFSLHVDQTFTPGGSDVRDLGIRVFCFYLGKAKD